MYVFLTILIGFGGAVLAGMFGIGGAGLTTLALRVILGATPAIALGTPLPVVIPTALAGSFIYYRNGLLDLRLAAWCSLGGVAGSVGGAMLTKVVEIPYLMLLTGAIVLYLAGMTIYRGVTGTVQTEVAVEDETVLSVADGDTEPTAEERGGRQSALLYVAVGLAGGFFSGLLGIGGGIVLVPAFLYVLRMPIKQAFGTSLAVIAVVAIPGTVVHSLLGHISWPLFLYLVIGVIPGAYLGAKLAIRAREPVLYMSFGVLVAVFGVIFIVNEIIQL